MSCTIRDLPSAPPHRDWMPGENTILSFANNITDQLAWNVYLKSGEEGGETIFYNESNVDAISTTTQSTRNAPLQGDLLLFRSTNVHEVLPARGNRLTLSGFFGPSGSKELRLGDPLLEASGFS
ncbi:2OG-Fe(II) oxygenase [Phyllobacterium sp. K27]